MVSSFNNRDRNDEAGHFVPDSHVQSAKTAAMMDAASASRRCHGTFSTAPMHSICSRSARQGASRTLPSCLAAGTIENDSTAIRQEKPANKMAPVRQRIDQATDRQRRERYAAGAVRYVSC